MKKQKNIVEMLNRLSEHYGQQDWWEDDNRIADWISMILIQQTTEKNAKNALNNLTDHLDVDSLLSMELEKLQELIKPAGFFRQKSTYIKNLMMWFESYESNFESFESWSTEHLRKELLTIKGVGPETADAMLLYIFDRKVFICDQYAMRLFEILGFGSYKTYAKMHRETLNLTDNISIKQCKEWHSSIDEHGKVFGKNPDIDETWLIEKKS